MVAGVRQSVNYADVEGEGGRHRWFLERLNPWLPNPSVP